MNPHRRLIGLLLLGQLAGCTGLNAPPESNGQPKTLAPEANHYEQQIIADAEAAASENRWATAFGLYRQALGKLPDSPLLQQGIQALRKRQSEQLAKLEQERLIAKGEWLVKDLAISQLADDEATDSWFGDDPLAQKHHEAAELATQLALLGKRALEQKNLDLAARAIPLAEDLSPTDDTKALQEQLRVAVKALEPKPASKMPDPPKSIATAIEQSVPAPKQPLINDPPGQQPIEVGKTETNAFIVPPAHEQKKAKHLLGEFKQALTRGNFAEARQLMEKLQKQGVDRTTFANLSKQLDEHVSGQVKYLIEAGVNDYSQQHYDEALKVWKKAQALDPSNGQLIAHIERVTKVLEKLQGLRNKHPS